MLMRVFAGSDLQEWRDPAFDSMQGALHRKPRLMVQAAYASRLRYRA